MLYAYFIIIIIASNFGFESDLIITFDSTGWVTGNILIYIYIFLIKYNIK